MKLKGQIICLLLMLILSLLTGCQQSKKPVAINGSMDLSDWNFDTEGIIPLDGNWEFYWNELLGPKDVFAHHLLTGYYNVNEYWNRYSFPSKGFATYRLKIKLDGREHLLGICTSKIFSEYKLYINGELIDSYSADNHSNLFYFYPKIKNFIANSNELVIILQIKNNSRYFAGVLRSITLGSVKAMNQGDSLNFTLELLVICILLFAGIYLMVFYISTDRSFGHMMFALFCIDIAIRCSLVNHTLLHYIFPNLPYTVGPKIAWLTVPIAVLTMVFYMKSIFPEDVPALLSWYALVIQALAIITILLGDSYQYTTIMMLYFLVSLPILLGGIYSAVQILIKRRNFRVYYYLIMSIMILGGMIDAIAYLHIIRLNYYYFGMFFVISLILHNYMMAKMYTRHIINVNTLEKNVALSLTKADQLEADFLAEQIKPHFLYNTLTTIAQLCRTNPDKAGSLLQYFIDYLKSSLRFDSSEQKVELATELKHISAYFYIERARFGNIELEYDIDEALHSCHILHFILQPLIENAIKHGLRSRENGGKIYLRIHQRAEWLHFDIEDNGIGITKEDVGQLLIPSQENSGIGLYNINMRLLRYYKSGLTISSEPGQGTNVHFEIPYDSVLK